MARKSAAIPRQYGNYGIFLNVKGGSREGECIPTTESKSRFYRVEWGRDVTKTLGLGNWAQIKNKTDCITKVRSTYWTICSQNRSICLCEERKHYAPVKISPTTPMCLSPQRWENSFTSLLVLGILPEDLAFDDMPASHGMADHSPTCDFNGRTGSVVSFVLHFNNDSKWS